MSKKTGFFGSLWASAVLLCFWGELPAQKPYTDLTFPPLREIEVPQVRRISLANGMELFVLEDHELPLINLSALIRVGSLYEPAEKSGLASITGTVMRSGGTRGRTGEEIDEALEGIAASVETGIGLESGSASMSVLKDDLEKGLSILADILMEPAFPEDKIELAKLQARSAVSRRNDRVGAITVREFTKLIYGPESPYARQVEYATLERITREDLVAFHGRYFHPNNVLMAVWGDFETAELVKRIEEAFRAWKPREIEFSPVPEVDYRFKSSVALIRKDDVNQTDILMGHIGGLRSDPDYFALTLMNRILGTGFTSRLFREVRSRQGLAYSVYGYFVANYSYPGVFYVGCQTKSETTLQAIRALKREVEKMTEDLVAQEELDLARESFLNAFVFNFDSRGEIANRLMTYAFYGYPENFLERTRKSIEEVTREDILRVARKHLHPDQMQILAVGQPENFDEPLSVLGPVTPIDITIPEP